MSDDEEEGEEDSHDEKSKTKKVVKKRTRSDWERLGMATSLANNAVQWSLGIAMATKSPGVRGVRAWCSSVVFENFNHVTHFNTHFVVKSTRIPTHSYLTHLQ